MIFEHDRIFIDICWHFWPYFCLKTEQKDAYKFFHRKERSSMEKEVFINTNLPKDKSASWYFWTYLASLISTQQEDVNEVAKIFVWKDSTNQYKSKKVLFNIIRSIFKQALNFLKILDHIWACLVPPGEGSRRCWKNFLKKR